MTAQHGPVEWLDGGPAATTARRRRSTARIALVAGAVLGIGGVATLALWPDAPDSTTHQAGPVTPAVATRSALPGALSVSTRSLHVAGTVRSTSFGIANTGDLPVIYQVSTRTPWISAPAIGGSLGGESGRRVDLLVDPPAPGNGRLTGTVVVSWDGGEDIVVRVHVASDEVVVSSPVPTPPQSTPGSR